MLHFEVLLLGIAFTPARCLKRMSNVWTHLQMMSILRSGGDYDLGVGWIEKCRSRGRGCDFIAVSGYLSILADGGQ